MTSNSRTKYERGRTRYLFADVCTTDRWRILLVAVLGFFFSIDHNSTGSIVSFKRVLPSGERVEFMAQGAEPSAD
jgi:hypothetical protein